MSSSAVGSIVPPIEIISPDGTKGSFSDIKGRSILVFFNEPDNVDCSVTRIRLSANPNVRELIERGELTVVCVHPGEPGEEWKTAAASLPEAWHKVAMPAAHDYFDLRIKPQLVYLNGGHKVLAKTLACHTCLEHLKWPIKRTKIHLQQMSDRKSIAVLVSGGVDSAVVVHQLAQDPSLDLHLFYIRIGMDDGRGDCSAEEDIEMCSLIARQYGLPPRSRVVTRRILGQCHGLCPAHSQGRSDA